MALDIDFTRRNKKPRLLSEKEREKLDEFVEAIHYSARYGAPISATSRRRKKCGKVWGLMCYRYSDSEYEYRHVQLPKPMLKAIPKDYFDGNRGTLKLLWEEEWRGLGITQVSSIFQQE